MEITPLFITDLVSQIKQGLKIEEDKLDLKREWYDLKNNDSRDRDEFCKDIAAMANTTGPPGYIIIGVDEKSGSLLDSPFHKSGLDDKSRLRDIVVKRVDLPPRFDVKEVQVEDSGQKNDNMRNISSTIHRQTTCCTEIWEYSKLYPDSKSNGYLSCISKRR